MAVKGRNGGRHDRKLSDYIVHHTQEAESARWKWRVMASLGCLHQGSAKTQAVGHTHERFFQLDYLRWKTHPKHVPCLLVAAHEPGHGFCLLALTPAVQFIHPEFFYPEALLHWRTCLQDSNADLKDSKAAAVQDLSGMPAAFWDCSIQSRGLNNYQVLHLSIRGQP